MRYLSITHFPMFSPLNNIYSLSIVVNDNDLVQSE